jgi:AcrR family transcriptional regulator
VTPPPGLRERKKQQTRTLIADTAWQMFAGRGFDGVSVAEIARTADVSEGTVFNYFSTKESLFFDRMVGFEGSLLAAIRARPTGQSVLAAFGEFLLTGSAGLSRTMAGEPIAMAARLIGDSRALQAREREIIAEYTVQLAELLAEETGASVDNVEPTVVAHALMGVHRSLIEATRRKALTRPTGRALAGYTRRQTARAVARLENGLADYAVKASTVNARTTADRS